MTARDDLDNAIRGYVEDQETNEPGELVSNWVVVAVTSTVESGAGLQVVTQGGSIPYWQLKGLLVHALDVVADNARRGDD